MTCLANYVGQPAKLAHPFDFMAVNDHSDGMGVVAAILAGSPHILSDRYGRELHQAFKQRGDAANAHSHHGKLSNGMLLT
jgi:hypothetical protein